VALWVPDSEMVSVGFVNCGERDVPEENEGLGSPVTLMLEVIRLV